jgi:PAS domain S-box-containing protein
MAAHAGAHVGRTPHFDCPRDAPGYARRMSSKRTPGSLVGDGWTTLGEAIEEMVWIWSAATGRVLYTNPAFERFWGRQAGDLGPGPEALLDLVAPDDVERLRKSRAGLPQTGYADEYKVTQPTVGERASRLARLRERAFAMPASDGTQLIAHVAKDVSWQFDTTAQLRAEITRRTDAERSLNDANARLQAMVATANDAVITIDQKSLVIDWNNAAERMFGYSRREAIGRDLSELIIPHGHREHHNRGIEQFLKTGKGQILNRRVETKALRRNGEEFDAELSVWPVRTGEGFTFSSFVRDISRRKAAAKALADSESKYRKVVENVNEGILVTAGGRILYANPKALALTGLDEETAMSKPFIEFIHPDDRDRVLQNHLKRLKGEPVENYYQFRVINSAGEARWLEISAVLFEWQGAAATLNFLTDVTQRRQAEDDMRHALRRERELSEMKSRFVAVASHEFRTPLAAILSSVELLDDYGNRLPDDERSEILGLIKSAVTRMNGMIEQVLLTSKLESGRFVFTPAPGQVPALLVQLAAELDQANPQASRIAMECEGLEERRMIDVQLVRHILMNLLGNALKYSSSDSPVVCSVSAEGERLCFRIKDRGIGIPAADLPRLFQTFHRGTNVGNIQGTGIGLHIVKECVDLHQGTIEVESEAGSGTTFRVSLLAPPA